MLSHVRLVEIEIHSFCNRKCIWCPNREIDRRSNYIQMDHFLYTQILLDLKKNNFKGAISYSRYNEPMATPALLKERLLEAKEILPGCKLVTNTNGDYITEENLENLLIDELTVMDYDCLGVNSMKNKLSEAGITIDKIEDNFVHGYLGDMKVLGVADWPVHANIEDRGGSLKEYSKNTRTAHCSEPTFFIGIDYNGLVTPCCHIRSDNLSHGQYVLGDLKHQKLSDIYNSSKGVRFRDLTLAGDFKTHTPCMCCEKKPGRYTRNVPCIEY